MKRLITVLMFLLFCFHSAVAQYLVSTELLVSYTAEEAAAAFNVPKNYGIDSYKVIYTTKDINGVDHEASGLMTVPTDPNKVFPMVIAQHGTVGGREDVPSRLAGGYQLGLILASYGFSVIQPDFLGLGDSPGIHPYVHADSEAWVARDMLRAAREYEEMTDGVNVNDQIFITGYSQGGHAAMAVHRLLELEHSDEFTVTAASHMSGPYSISEKMIDFTLSDDEYFFCAYLAWVALSMKAAYPAEMVDFEMEDIFKAEYLDNIEQFVNEEIDLFDMNDDLIAELNANVGRVTPKEMLKPEILDAILNDPTHPLSVALAKQDVYDWAPIAPTRLMYCTGDDQVTFENAILAEQVMNANGAANVLSIENGATLDHGGCVTPAASNTLLFFLLQSSVTTSTGEWFAQEDILTATQLDEQLILWIETSNIQGRSLELNITNLYGQSQIQSEVNNDLMELNVADLTTGMYVINVIEENRLIQAKKIFIK